jgi:hypothetical protein
MPSRAFAANHWLITHHCLIRFAALLSLGLAGCGPTRTTASNGCVIAGLPGPSKRGEAQVTGPVLNDFFRNEAAREPTGCLNSTIDRVRKDQPILIFLVGRADKRQLHSEAQRIYGDNFTLAYQRALSLKTYLVDRYRDKLPQTTGRDEQEDREKQVARFSSRIAVTAGSPNHIDPKPTDRDMFEDRSVEVYGLWIEDHGPSSLAGEGVLSSLGALWEQAKSGQASAYSALAAIAGAIFALFIGIMAARINANTVKGQRVHEQIRMVLEIDKELIACPQLWGIFDDPNPPATPMLTLIAALRALATAVQSTFYTPERVATAIEKLTEPLDSLKRALQSEALASSEAPKKLTFLMAAIDSVKAELRTPAPLEQTLADELKTLKGGLESMTTGLRGQVPASEAAVKALDKLPPTLETLEKELQRKPPVGQKVADALGSLTTPLESLNTALKVGGILSSSELEGKKKALVFSYLNMFDYVHGFYGRRILIWLKPWPSRDRQEWKAWRLYMKNFFATSRLTQQIWKINRSIGMYPKSFTKFVNKKLLPHDQSNAS